MTYNYPFFSFPHFRRYYPNYYSNMPSSHIINTPISNAYSPIKKTAHPNIKNISTSDNISHKEQEKKASPKSSASSFSFLNNLLHQEDRNEDESFFEILGIKLYYDDILLISLIFFLYQEEVKDQYLFIALILLLLS